MQTLGTVAVRRPAAGLLAVRSTLDLAACEVSERRRLILVYAVVGRQALLAELVGHERERERRGREITRILHGRRS